MKGDIKLKIHIKMKHLTLHVKDPQRQPNETPALLFCLNKDMLLSKTGCVKVECRHGCQRNWWLVQDMLTL